MDFNLISFSLFDPSSLWAIFQMVVGLGFVIFVHELGHFAVAKACGVKCEKFYVGFDAFDIKIGDRVIVPRKLVHWKWGETEYGVGILPLGGYVKMLGQDDNPSQIAEERKRSMQLAEQSGEAEVPSVSSQVPRLDPRSYQAKSVPQRMAIISAGVIMNLIFAVIFAAIAFGTGVNYEPPHVGFTTPGSPAWQHNLDGVTVLSINDQTTRNRYFTFGHLRESIVFEGESSIELSVLPAPELSQLSDEPFDDSQLNPISLSIIPAKNLLKVKGAENLPAIGIAPAYSAVLGSDPAGEGQAASAAQPPLKAGDRIVKINHKSIVRNSVDENGRPYRQHSVFLLRMLLSQVTDEEITITVERTDPRTKQMTLIDSVIPPNPMRTLGLNMEIGRVVALQVGSPAADAGIQIDDQIIAIEGEPVGDPFVLQSRMTRLAKQAGTTEFTIVRDTGNGTSQELSISIQPRLPRSPSLSQDGEPFAVDTLGIAFHVKNIVAGHNSSADPASQEVKVGAKIAKVHFLMSDEQAKRFSPLTSKPIDLSSGKVSWAEIESVVQMLEPGTQVELVCQLNNSFQTIRTSVREYEGFYAVNRGLPISLEQMNYQAKSFVESLQLGLHQTWIDATKVLRFLGKLIRGEISVTSLGGPGTIVAAATSEASQGTSRLLLFLTLLSANLAIVNFLPIPVLDGGHMLFLAYEGIFRRPVSERLQIILSFAGLIFIVGLMLLVISLDVWRWSGLF